MQGASSLRYQNGWEFLDTHEMRASAISGYVQAVWEIYRFDKLYTPVSAISGCKQFEKYIDFKDYTHQHQQYLGASSLKNIVMIAILIDLHTHETKVSAISGCK